MSQNQVQHSLTGNPPDEAAPDVLMKQYQLLVDAYKSYLDIVLKFTVFTYAVTGGILSFYLSQKNEGIMRFGLVFPIVMNVTFAIFGFFAARTVEPMAAEVERVTSLLKLDAFPEIRFLKFILLMLGGLYLVIAFGLVVVSVTRAT